jgi:hypothetical protein
MPTWLRRRGRRFGSAAPEEEGDGDELLDESGEILLAEADSADLIEE